MNKPIQSDGARSIHFVWLPAILLMALITLAAFWYPVQRISQYADINYNEGWNTYRADMAARGNPLYGLPPRFTVTNYPPLSFHFLGFLGKFMGGFTSAGRWIALASLVFLAIAVAALVQQYTGHWRLGVYAALLFGMGLAVFMPDRVGMNDPQLLGLAWSLAGLWLYARNPRSNWLLCASAVAFAISLFTKHNLLAFPGAVGLHLLLERAWKPLAVWSAALAATAGALLLLTFRWDGPYFFSHLLVPRTYSFLGGWEHVAPYLLEFQILFAAAVLWSAYYATWPARNLLAIAFVLAHLFGFVFAGGDGVVENVLFDALVMLAVITAIGIGDLESKLITLRFGPGLLLLALTMPYLGSLALLPSVLIAEHHANKLRPNLDAEFRRAVEFLQSRPGPALCEDLLLCYDAGKPPLYDAFYATSQVKVGRMSEADVVNYIQSSRFPTIEITLPAEQPLAPLPMYRFSQPVLRAILERYRPALRTSELTLLVPKEEPEVSGNFR
jgi:hypothetical protein